MHNCSCLTPSGVRTRRGPHANEGPHARHDRRRDTKKERRGGPLVRAFSVGQRGRGSGVSTLNVAEASALQAATDESIAKRKKCDGSVIVAQKNKQLVGFALVNDDVLETVAVAVDERGGASARSSSTPRGRWRVPVAMTNCWWRSSPRMGAAATSSKVWVLRAPVNAEVPLAVLAKPLPRRPPALVVSVVIALPVLVALAGVAASRAARLMWMGTSRPLNFLAAQLDVEGASGRSPTGSLPINSRHNVSPQCRTAGHASEWHRPTR